MPSSEMSFEALEKEACSLPPEQRRRLIAHLMAIQSRDDDPTRAQRLADKIDDPNDSRWLAPEEAEKELGLTDGNG